MLTAWVDPALREYARVRAAERGQMVSEWVAEAIRQALLSKIRTIDQVVGGTVESALVASTLRQAEVVGSHQLGLASTDEATVQAALLAVRNKWLSGDGDSPKVDDTAKLLADIADAYEDPSALGHE